jgi:uncharacterized protein YhjY with autotransporter beta-barrel domain
MGGAVMSHDLKQHLTLPEGSVGDAHDLSTNRALPVLSVLFLVASLSWQSATAETFNQASGAELNRICRQDFAFNSNDQLGVICGKLQAGGNTAASGIGSQSQPSAILISQQQIKDAETKRLKANRPPASADVIAAQWDKFSTFLTAGATTLRHYQNPFEDGYNATIPSVTLGGGYAITSALEAGLAFNYANSNASFNSGGGFDSNSYTPLLYFNYLPFENAFANLALSYTRRNQSIDRFAVAGTTGGGSTIGGITSGKQNANQYSLNFLSGYDFAIENVTVGPRVGVDVRQWEMNSYQETSGTGLELRYNDQHQTSLQTSLGIFASSAHSFSFGVIVPQINVSWIHEFANDARTINAHFIQATDSTTGPGFFFNTEHPARDWALIDIGASLLLQKGVQFFANFSTVQGNQNFESYGGNLGVRVGW